MKPLSFNFWALLAVEALAFPSYGDPTSLQRRRDTVRAEIELGPPPNTVLKRDFTTMSLPENFDCSDDACETRFEDVNKALSQDLLDMSAVYDPKGWDAGKGNDFVTLGLVLQLWESYFQRSSKETGTVDLYRLRMMRYIETLEGSAKGIADILGKRRTDYEDIERGVWVETDNSRRAIKELDSAMLYSGYLVDAWNGLFQHVAFIVDSAEAAAGDLDPEEVKYAKNVKDLMKLKTLRRDLRKFNTRWMDMKRRTKNYYKLVERITFAQHGVKEPLSKREDDVPEILKKPPKKCHWITFLDTCDDYIKAASPAIDGYLDNFMKNMPSEYSHDYKEALYQVQFLSDTEAIPMLKASIFAIVTSVEAVGRARESVQLPADYKDIKRKLKKGSMETLEDGKLQRGSYDLAIKKLLSTVDKVKQDMETLQKQWDENPMVKGFAGAGRYIKRLTDFNNLSGGDYEQFKVNVGGLYDIAAGIGTIKRRSLSKRGGTLEPVPRSCKNNQCRAYYEDLQVQLQDSVRDFGKGMSEYAKHNLNSINNLLSRWIQQRTSARTSAATGKASNAADPIVDDIKTYQEEIMDVVLSSKSGRNSDSVETVTSLLRAIPRQYASAKKWKEQNAERQKILQGTGYASDSSVDSVYAIISAKTHPAEEKVLSNIARETGLKTVDVKNIITKALRAAKDLAQENKQNSGDGIKDKIKDKITSLLDSHDVSDGDVQKAFKSIVFLPDRNRAPILKDISSVLMLKAYQPPKELDAVKQVRQVLRFITYASLSEVDVVLNNMYLSYDELSTAILGLDELLHKYKNEKFLQDYSQYFYQYRQAINMVKTGSGLPSMRPVDWENPIDWVNFPRMVINSYTVLDMINISGK